MANSPIWLLAAFLVVHFIIDFPLQGPYQWKNKGTYGHPGGILHAFLHALASWWVMIMFAVEPGTSVVLALANGAIHYHIDWAKMRLNAKCGYKPDTHPEFWTLLGLDQLAHQLTYVAMVYVAGK